MPAPKTLRQTAAIVVTILAFASSASAQPNSTFNPILIYSTFDPGDVYDMSSGWSIGGPGVYSQALQFTPVESGMVQTIEIAAFRLAGGKAVNVSLANDDGGNLPGSVIEIVPICCFGDVPAIQLATSELHPKLTAGTKYWLVVTPIGDSDYFGWNRILDPPYQLNAQRSMSDPWSTGLEYRGTVRIRGDASTPAGAATWGRLKSLYR